MKKQKLKIAIVITSVIIVATGLAYTSYAVSLGLVKAYRFIENPLGENLITMSLRVPVVEAEPTMQEWVKAEIEKAGLNWEEANCIIKNESNWDNWAQNWNTNGTTDSGIFQINSVHKGTISLEDRFNYKKATKWAINKRLNEGNWEAWYGYLKCK